MYTQISKIDVSLQRIFSHFLTVRNAVANKANLNTTELELLSTLLLSGKQMSIKEVSNALHLCSQAVTKITKNLKSLGLISAQKSTADKRVTFLLLSESGLKLAQFEKSIRDVLMLRALQAYTVESIEEFNHILAVIQSSVGDLSKAVIDSRVHGILASASPFDSDIELDETSKSQAAG